MSTPKWSKAELSVEHLSFPNLEACSILNSTSCFVIPNQDFNVNVSPNDPIIPVPFQNMQDNSTEEQWKSIIIQDVIPSIQKRQRLCISFILAEGVLLQLQDRLIYLNGFENIQNTHNIEFRSMIIY